VAAAACTLATCAGLLPGEQGLQGLLQILGRGYDGEAGQGGVTRGRIQVLTQVLQVEAGQGQQPGGIRQLLAVDGRLLPLGIAGQQRRQYQWQAFVRHRRVSRQELGEGVGFTFKQLFFYLISAHAQGALGDFGVGGKHEQGVGHDDSSVPLAVDEGIVTRIVPGAESGLVQVRATDALGPFIGVELLTTLGLVPFLAPIPIHHLAQGLGAGAGGQPVEPLAFTLLATTLHQALLLLDGLVEPGQEHPEVLQARHAHALPATLLEFAGILVAIGRQFLELALLLFQALSRLAQDAGRRLLAVLGHLHHGGHAFGAGHAHLQKNKYDGNLPHL
jgi:hypothetical protein